VVNLPFTHTEASPGGRLWNRNHINYLLLFQMVHRRLEENQFSIEAQSRTVLVLKRIPSLKPFPANNVSS
jgi:hypothetical protein